MSIADTIQEGLDFIQRDTRGICYQFQRPESRKEIYP